MALITPQEQRRIEKLTKHRNNCSLGVYCPNLIEQRSLTKAARKLFRKAYISKAELRYTLQAMIYAALLDRERSEEEINSACAEAKRMGIKLREAFANRLYLMELSRRAPTSRGGFCV